MEFPVTFTEFYAKVDADKPFADFHQSDERLDTYYLVGTTIYRACYNKRTTATTYDRLDAETSDLVIHHYNAKRAREAADNAILDQVKPLLDKLSREARYILLSDYDIPVFHH